VASGKKSWLIVFAFGLPDGIRLAIFPKRLKLIGAADALKPHILQEYDNNLARKRVGRNGGTCQTPVPKIVTASRRRIR
jgi:hypothetical protein